LTAQAASGLASAAWRVALPLVAGIAFACNGWAQTPQLGTTRAQALQACPTVDDQIVDLDMLADGLKKSKAVGVLEKLRLKSSIDSLVARLKAFHNGARSYSLAQLQEQYDLLLMRIATHLQDKDEPMHSQLCNAWETIWHELATNGSMLQKMS
jgi:hypothetical protein